MNKRRSTRNKNRDNETLKQKEFRNPTISHNVIIKNICDKSLLEASVTSLLPPQLDNIYRTMMNDLCFINNVQSRKKLDFYHCNISFYKGEEIISEKRKALIEFVRKNKPKNEEENIKKRKSRVYKRKIVKNENKDYNNVNITSKRPYRKRKAPIKFENDDNEPNSAIYEEINIREVENEVINLSSDSSSSSSKKPKKEEAEEGEEEVIKSKNYFREPTQRKPPIINNSKKLKEHTLLDKIMLGINCVRQWTDRGLHLTKIAESDLGLLNKRLSSIKCTMSDLEEHTDENNNKSLSVFIQSEMFTGFTAISQQPLAISSSIPLTKVKEEPPKSSVSETSVINVLNRHKTKQHIASMYRQKHNLPSILSKPVLNNNKNSFPSPQKSSGQFPRFSAVKMENKDNDAPIVADSLPAPPTPIQWDSSMSASRLLMLKKSQNVDNNNITTKPIVPTEESPQSLSLPQVQNIPSTIGFTNPRPTVIYQTVPRNNLVLPLYISPQINAAPTPRRTFCIPLRQPTSKQSVRFSQSDLSKFQPIPLKKVFPTNLRTASRTDVSSNGTQSTILKNLLQQSSNQTITNGNLSRVSSSHMVPLSVFQNKSKWQVGSVVQYHLKK